MALGILLFPWRDFTVAKFRTAFLIGLLCVAASALNPSGLNNFLYPLTYAFDQSSPFRGLGEWLSPFKPGGIRSPLFFYFMWAPLLAALYAVPLIRRRTGVPWEGLALTGLTLAMALTSRRFIPLFGISLAVMLAPLAAYVCKNLMLARLRPAVACLALVAALFRLMPYPLSSGPAFHYLVAEYSYPVDMLNFIEANKIKGNVYALYNWGGYIHWRTDGDLQVFIDGRADTVYDAKTYLQYVDVLREADGWLQSVEDSGAEFFLWPVARNNGQLKLGQLLASGKWQPVYRDATSYLLARSDIRLPEEYQVSVSGPYRDLGIAQNFAWSGEPDKAVTYFEKVRAAVPYQQHACSNLVAIYRGTGRKEQARQVLAECRSWFPSRYLQ
jgi:hypothetical protein